MNRRDFLNLSVITAATTALAGCGRPAEPAFFSQAHMPEFFLPGIAQWYATTCSECAAGCGIGVRIIGGRAKKIEGIPTHPLSRGGHCLRAETSLQALYNPDRLQQPWRRQGSEQTPMDNWADAIKTLATSFEQSNGLWITGPLTGSIGGLVVAAAQATGAKIWVLDFPGTTVDRIANAHATGSPRLPYYDIADADYVVNFGADLLSSAAANNVEYNWQYGQFRSSKGRRHRGIMVSFTSRMNLTASCSDRWVPVKPGSEGMIAQAVAGLLGHGGGEKVSVEEAAAAAGIDADLIHRLADKLKSARKAVAIGGFDNSAYSNGVSALSAIAALNAVLPGATKKSFETDVVLAPKGAAISAPSNLMITAKEALTGLKAGTFTTVWVHDANPAYLLPQTQLGVASALKKAHTFVFTPYTDETSVLAELVLATTSMLEQWGDVRVEGPNPVYGLQQPVALPAPGSKPFGEILLAALAANPKTASLVPKNARGAPATSMRDVIMAGWKESEWDRALERGGVYEDASLDWSPYPAPAMYPPPSEPATTKVMPAGVGLWDGMKTAAAPALAAPKFSGNGKFVLVPYPSPTGGDGSIANRPWVPELPDPMAEANWQTWVELNPETYKMLGLEPRDGGGIPTVTLQNEIGTSPPLPCICSPAVHPDVVAVPMGMGHTSFGRYAYDKGYNPMNLVEPTFQAGSDELVWASTYVSIRPTGQKAQLATYDWRPYGKRELYEDQSE